MLASRWSLALYGAAWAVALSSVIPAKAGTIVRLHRIPTEPAPAKAGAGMTGGGGLAGVTQLFRVLAQATGNQATADTALERRTTEVASQLRCPVCQGLSVQDSPSELALELRDVVRDQLRAGKSPAEVKAYFVERYGEWILLRPKPSGFNRLLYLLPFVAVLAGAVTITLAVRKWTRTGSNPDIAAGDGT